MTTSSGKHLQDITQAHIVSLMYKLITSSDDLSKCFDRDRNTRREEFNKKNLKCEKHQRIMLEDVFGLSE